jgi:hypothetical protein
LSDLPGSSENMSQNIYGMMMLVLMVAGVHAAAPTEMESAFQKHAGPFLKQYCNQCHNADKMSSGIRVDHLTAAFADNEIRLWDAILHQVRDEAMPPKGKAQPTRAEREQIISWIQRSKEIARLRPTPKNGGARRLTVAQYKNTLRELLKIDDIFTDILPPDAVSRDGFLNNQSTLQLSPLLLESYFEIADKALKACIVDEKSKPVIQNFRMDLGASINKNPCPDQLILGANSLLLNNRDFVVTQSKPIKSFAFDPFIMQTKYRFIEGYEGNSTVRGWRNYDSIYHAVYACMRGSTGYPKGLAHSTVQQGLLLRPAIPSAEIFGVDSTYGPRANFKIALRELPDQGRFRITVNAAKYDDGLLIDPGVAAQSSNSENAIVCNDPSPSSSITVKQAGIYQVDVHSAAREKPARIDSSRLNEKLIGNWPLNGNALGNPETKTLEGKLQGDARFVNSPFGKALSLDGNGDSVLIPRNEVMNVKDGEFTVAAWIHPTQLRQAGIVCLGKYSWTHGWYFDMPNNKGVLRIETAGPDNQSNGTVSSPPGTIRPNAWQHVAAVVRRGNNETRLYVNGFLVGKGVIGPANLDNPKVDLYLGRIQDAQQFKGELSQVRIYQRALDESEIQSLVEPGRKFVQPPREKPSELNLSLGERQFSGTLNQPAFVVVRLPAGEMKVNAQSNGAKSFDRVVFTPLPKSHELTRKFISFEKRSPQLGVSMGFRRDCGSTLAPIGQARPVTSCKPGVFVFEGAIRNYPSPDVEKDNVNYLAGVREIGVHSEYTDGREMPRLLISSVEFEGPFYETWPPATHRNIFVDFDRKDDVNAYARKIIREFATRAYRAPISPHIESALLNVFEKSSRSGASFQESIKDVLQVVLTSPQFLFLIENSQTPNPEPLNNYELASKLSYFLWNGPPDETTLKLASKGELRDQLGAEVLRMIGDPRFSGFINEYASQWLALEKFQVLEPDRRQFPRLTRDAKAQLLREPAQYLQYLVRNNLPVKNLVESDFIIANEVVAGYYDLGDKTESGFDFIPIQHGRKELGGFLGQAAIMAGLSDGRESNPVKRGAWLARRIIAEPPDDPPPNVPALAEDSKKLSLRERLEQHRNQKGCTQCHAKIDPWGVPLEEFDAGGRLKLQKIDARSVLPDKKEVSGLDDLKRYLVDDRIDQLGFSMLKHLAIYATGRNLSFNELEFLKKEGLKLKANGYRMQDMILFVVNSRIFTEK